MKKAKEGKPLKATAKGMELRRRHEETDDFLTDSSHLRRPAVSSQEKENLGDRIRKAREMRGLTLQDLSSRTGIDVDTLERVESNEMVPPLGELIKLGKAVEMKMGYFISPGVDKPMTIVRSGNRPMVSRYGKRRSEQYGYFYESLAPEKANRFMEPFLITMVPTDVEELSSHDGQEFIFVLEGEMEVILGNHTDVLYPGDSIYYDSTIPHRVQCHEDKGTKILAVLYAAGT